MSRHITSCCIELISIILIKSHHLTHHRYVHISSRKSSLAFNALHTLPLCFDFDVKVDGGDFCLMWARISNSSSIYVKIRVELNEFFKRGSIFRHQEFSTCCVVSILQRKITIFSNSFIKIRHKIKISTRIKICKWISHFPYRNSFVLLKENSKKLRRFIDVSAISWNFLTHNWKTKMIWS